MSHARRTDAAGRGRRTVAMLQDAALLMLVVYAVPLVFIALIAPFLLLFALVRWASG